MSRWVRPLSLLRSAALRTGALSVLTLLGAGGRPAVAVDASVLRAHAEGRRLVLAGDVRGAQTAWDRALGRASRPLHAIVLERTCDEAAFTASLARRRGMQPLWVAGGDCRTLLWGAFESAAEAREQSALLPPGVLPAEVVAVALRPPLAAWSPSPAPPADPVRAVRAEAPREATPEEAPAPVTPPPREVVAEEAPAPVTPPPREVVAEDAPPPVTSPPREVVAEKAPPQTASPPREVVAARVEPPVAPPPREAVAERVDPPVVPPPREVVAEKAPAELRSVPEAPPRRRLDEPLRLPKEPEGLGEDERQLRQARAARSFASGNALWAEGDYDAAIDAFEEALELDPDNARILNNLGTAWLKAERPDRAVAVLQRAVELDPSYARAYLNLSTALYAADRPAEALAALQRVIELEPANLDARYNKAAVLAEMRRWADARAALAEGLEQAPGDPRLRQFLRQVDEQIEVLSAGGGAAASAPVAAASPGPCAGLASDLLRSRRAVELFRAGEAAMASRDLAAAEQAFVGVLDCDPTSSAAANRLGAARLAGGDASGAAAAFDLAARLDPAHLEARTNRCLAAYAAEGCPEALGCLERLVAEAGAFAPARREQALMLYRCGRSIEAESAAVRGLELAPDEPRLRGLLERIAGERIGR